MLQIIAGHLPEWPKGKQFFALHLFILQQQAKKVEQPQQKKVKKINKKA